MLKINKITLLLVFLAFSLCSAKFAQYGKLSVSGGKILDKNSNEIILRGMSLYWYQGPFCNGQPGNGCGQPGNTFYTSANISSLATNWNVNVIRAAIGNVQQEPAVALTMAKNMMDWANTAGIYVIIDNHSHIAHRSAHATAANNFFRDVSAYVKSKGYTHVLYEIYNEPVYDNDTWNAHNSPSSAPKTTWAQIKSYSQNIINTIRDNDPDGLIIVGTPGYSSDISTPRGDPLTGTYAKNVLYALHFYAGESGHGVYRFALEGAYCNNFPVFVTEWGTSPASGSGAISTSNSNTWISLLEAAKVSHVNWSLSNTSETSAALTGTSVTGGLTASGDYIKNVISKLNSGTSITSICTPGKSTECLSQPKIDCSGPSVAVPTGKIGFNSNGSFANFAGKTGADSSGSGAFVGLINTSSGFTANYTIVGIEKPGSYSIMFNYASTAAGTISWQGNGISSGIVQISSSGSLQQFQYSEPKAIQINVVPEVPLNLTIQMPSANSFIGRWIYAYEEEDPVSLRYAASKNLLWSYNAAARTFTFETGDGSLTIYNLRGESKAAFAVNRSISLNALPSGTYIAVYRQGSEIQRKTIYLK